MSLSVDMPWRPVCIATGLFYSLGVLGIMDPLRGEATEKEATFYPVVASRNLTLAATILSFVYTGQQRALGTMMMCCSIMGVADIAFLLSRPGYSGLHMAVHLVKGVLFPTLGAKLLGWF
ncbi:hypothetical protein CcaverHIS641_0406000 [Cutaneotrichosporon cavernicola]|nr:hypothetical protein CcaverHIS641_0406000 [Cutaneotrichosporon cavernicola]